MSEETAHIEQSLFLIIDQDKRSRSFISRALQKIENAIVDHSDNTLQAIEHFEKKNYNIVFIDSHDSVVRTEEALQTIHDRAQFQTKSFMLIMKVIDVQKTIDLLRIGFQGFITKPFHADIILQKIKLLEQHDTADNDSTILLPDLLIADGNERYRKHLTAILSTRYRVVEAVTGFDTLVFQKIHEVKKIILSSSIDVIAFQSVIQKIHLVDKSSEIYVTLFDTSDDMREHIISIGATDILKRTYDDKTTVGSLMELGILP